MNCISSEEARDPRNIFRIFYDRGEGKEMCIGCFLYFEKEVIQHYIYPETRTTMLIEIAKINNKLPGVIDEFIGDMDIDYINYQDENGNTALHYIAFLYINQESGYEIGKSVVDAADILLEKGANLTIKNKEGDTPFDLFERGSNSEHTLNTTDKYAEQRKNLFNYIIDKYSGFDLKFPE